MTEPRSLAEDTLLDWENNPFWPIGTDTTIADVTDGSVKHDLYLYGPVSETARVEIKDWEMQRMYYGGALWLSM